MKAVDRLLSYIFQTPHLGLTLGSRSGDLDLHAFVDASYACYSDSKSHTGICLALGNDSGAFLALSKKQTITADSTTVAEFVAMHTGCQRVSEDYILSG
jgi:acetate kinase